VDLVVLAALLEDHQAAVADEVVVVDHATSVHCNEEDGEEFLEEVVSC
jgi:hypothetical protein